MAICGNIPDRSWYERPTLDVARDLIGCVLTTGNGTRETTSGHIVEVEAYCGPDDRASHSYLGKQTARNAAMFGQAGHAYIYLIYGMYHCFNITTDQFNRPHAILIRALEPVDGFALMRERAPKIAKDTDLCKGPGRLCRAMGITRELYGSELFRPDSPIILRTPVHDEHPTVDIIATTRIGIDYAGEHAMLPWRFCLARNPCVSRQRRTQPSDTQK